MMAKRAARQEGRRRLPGPRTPEATPPPVPSSAIEGLVEPGERSAAFAGLAGQQPRQNLLQRLSQVLRGPIYPGPSIAERIFGDTSIYPGPSIAEQILGAPGGAQAPAPITQADLPQAGLAPQVTTPHSPFALEAGLFHNAMMYTSGRILKAVDAQSRNFLPRQITDVIAALLPWRDWGFSSYQEALRALGYTEIPGAGTWMKDDEIASAATGGGGGQTATQYVTQRAGYGGGGGSLRSPNFSTLINWRI